jgi:(p)ppGpp synthase/HD superfamily hydrolase
VFVFDGGILLAMGALYSKRYRDALDDAAKLHRRQVRKKTDIPYVSHLLHVSALVWESGGSEDQAIAALLHDAVEDQGGAKMLRKIRERYGKQVARMVWACTDSSTKPKPPWVERKTRHLAGLANANDKALLIVAADHVVNVESIVGDLQQHGAKVWERFNASPESQVWYQQATYELLSARLGSDLPLVRRLDRAVGLLAVWAAVPRSAARPAA